MSRKVVALAGGRGGGWRGGGPGSVGVLLGVLLMLGGCAAAFPGAAEPLPHPCDSKIFCYGDLLKTVQLAGLYNDSKYFVDMSLKHSPDETYRDFEELMQNNNDNPSRDQIRIFVDNNFNVPDDEFVPWDPSDWNPEPEYLKKVVDPELEQWGKDLNEVWKKLGRKISPEVEQDPERYSQISVPNPVIVPGGRFREFYYWDSYWTIDGLLLSGMQDTVRGMLENFLDMVNIYGMVPNGGRVYYTRRSQPPYLIPMVKLYMDHTNDHEFLRRNIDLLEKEFMFWEMNRTVTVQGRKLAQYKVMVDDPRPESYREDFHQAQELQTAEEQQNLYIELKSGAESGWDYSTRWFVNNNTNNGTLKDIKISSIAPVDLNSLLCMNARILSQFYSRLGNYTQQVKYEKLAKEKNETMAKVFWDSTDGIWYDYDLNAESKRRYFYLSNIHPIWSGCYGQEDSRAHTIEKVIQYLKKNKVLNYVGGVPTSLENSGEQWDFPNAWAPLQHTIIMGLYEARSIHHEGESLAFELAEKWIRTNWKGYQQSSPHSMFEKYNVSVVGLAGGGGEYAVQLGFGWSNGVAMRLLDIFGDRLTATTGAASTSPYPSSLLSLLLLAFFPLTLQLIMTRSQ